MRLDALLESDPMKDLAWTRDANPDAYGLVAQLRRHYTRELDRRGLVSPEAITTYYETVRLSILTRIVRTSPGGYRVNDARFLIGTIYWRQQRFEDALRSWRDMSVDSSDSYVGAYSQILRVLQHGNTQSGAGTNRIDPMLYRAIRQILKNEQGRWLMFSYDRLRRFGYRFDTF